MNCCERTLIEAGKGTNYKGTFCPNGYCRDGEQIKCPTCKSLLTHHCDEAEGCYWFVRPLRKKRGKDKMKKPPKKLFTILLDDGRLSDTHWLTRRTAEKHLRLLEKNYRDTGRVVSYVLEEPCHD